MVDKVVRTERLELVGPDGRVRAVLACEDQTDGPALAMLDSEGKTRIIVGLSWNDMPQIQLTAPDGTARVALVVRPEGTGLLVLAEDGGHSKTFSASSDAKGE